MGALLARSPGAEKTSSHSEAPLHGAWPNQKRAAWHSCQEKPRAAEARTPWMLLLETPCAVPLAELGRLVLSARAAMETPSRLGSNAPGSGDSGSNESSPPPAFSPAPPVES